MIAYRSLTDRLRTQHEAIEEIIQNKPNERLFLQPQPGKWSIRDHIAHLAKYQPLFIERITRINNGEQPTFESYRAEDDPEFAVWQTWDIRTLLDRLYADRKTINTLTNELSCTQLTRTGVHQKFGELTITQWTEFFLLHEAHHIFAIFQLANNTSL